MKTHVDLLGSFGLRALPAHWTTVTIGDLLAEDRGISVGVMYPGIHDPSGIPLIRAGDLANDRINSVPNFRISCAKHLEYRRTALEGGELLLSLVGDIGQCAVVPEGLAGWNVARAIAVLRFKDRGVASYVRLALLSTALKNLIRAWATTTVQATLNLKEIRRLPLPWPPPNERLQIVEILAALDDKIELNLRMNGTLEAISLAIFKSWFMDSSINGEKGRVPAGWSVRTVGDVCRRVSMGPFGSDIRTDNFVPAGVPVIRGGNLGNGFIDQGFVYITEAKADELRNANAFPDDIVITHRGTLGQIGIIPRESQFPRYVVSQSQMVLSANLDLATPRFIFEFLRSPEGQHELLSNTSQTGVPAIARPVTAVKAMRLIVPPLDLQKRFQDIAQTLADKGTANEHENRTLLTLRDALLPKLISGEIRVGQAEKIVEAHA